MDNIIKALIFDFDGLILDTETPLLQSWEEVYHEHGVNFPLSRWMESLGGTPGPFDLYTELQAQLNQQIDLSEIQRKRRYREIELLSAQSPLPGVEKYLDDAIGLGLMLGIASSSEKDWVVPHLSRLGILSHFHVIKCADDVVNVKPAPDLYAAVLRELDLQANQAIAFEDSRNGALAANQAGLFCIAVPNVVSSQSSLDPADLLLHSLEEISLKDLLQQIGQGIANRGRSD
jgi:HAD superfamily hydrolase (TIGR01509 family)